MWKCPVLWLYICNALSHANHMGRSEADVRLNETTLRECQIFGGWFPGAESAEPCVEAWRHRWRLLRDASRGAETPRRRTRVLTVDLTQCTDRRTGSTWGNKKTRMSTWTLVSEGLVDMNAPRRSRWRAAEWILSDVGHWYWLFWVSRTWTKLRVTRNRLSLSLWTYFLVFIQFQDSLCPPWMFNMLEWVR